ncbi:MAG: hypothetical protein JWQ81_5369 [Amycolatopsis sp.]|nr:hypothetical protein [Amycolatopsis sp.]
MPSIGQLGAVYPEGISPREKALAEAVKTVYYQFNRGPLYEHAKRLRSSEASLSHWLHGRRIPAVKTLTLMHELATKDLLSRGSMDTPLPLADLLMLREAAKFGNKVYLCRNCASTMTASEFLTAAEDPEVDRRNADATSTNVLDRRNSPHSPMPPPGLDIVLVLLNAGKLQDAFSLLWAAGGELTTAEVAGAAQFFTDAQLPDASDLLLRSARRRPPDEVLGIVRYLLHADQREGAKVLVGEVM